MFDPDGWVATAAANWIKMELIGSISSQKYCWHSVSSASSLQNAELVCYQNFTGKLIVNLLSYFRVRPWALIS
jgi:hypothetical protein